MNTISIKYILKWKLSFAPHYKWSDDKHCFNCQTGKQIKQVYNNGCIGYNIQGKFYSLKYLKKEMRKIEQIKLPF